jgi:hypothetical protein
MHGHMNVKKNMYIRYFTVLVMQVITAYCTAAYDVLPTSSNSVRLVPEWPRMLPTTTRGPAWFTIPGLADPYLLRC